MRIYSRKQFIHEKRCNGAFSQEPAWRYSAKCIMTTVTEIENVVRRFHAVHWYVLALYLTIYCPNISFELARSSIHKAVIAHKCYEDEYEGEEYLKDSPYLKVNSGHMRMSRAFRVAMEFMDTGEYSFLDSRVINGNDGNTLLMVVQPPTDEEIKNGRPAQSKLIEISYILPRSELASSQMLASKTITKPVKDIVRRIAIVETGFRRELIAKAGYSMFIRFGKNMFTFNSDDIFYTDEDERWADVNVKEA